ncbi:MAG: hypothetical protein ACTSWP_01590 [Candidatus Freyarchaeota archaeon]
MARGLGWLSTTFKIRACLMDSWGYPRGSREGEVALQKVPLEAIDEGVSSAVCSPLR